MRRVSQAIAGFYKLRLTRKTGSTAPLPGGCAAQLQSAQAKVIGVMPDCMDKNGANVLFEMRQSGTYNFAQNQEICVVLCMSRAAIVVMR